MTPTSRTLKLMKKEGKICGITEHWNAFTRQRKDLFGFIDIICLHPEEKQIIAIQCTSTSNMGARYKKITTECKEMALTWVNSGGIIEIIGWSKKKTGNRLLWTPKRQIVSIQDLQ